MPAASGAPRLVRIRWIGAPYSCSSRAERLALDRQLLALGGADHDRRPPDVGRIGQVRLIVDHLRHVAGGQPGEGREVAGLDEDLAAVAFDAVPVERRLIERLAAHRLDREPVERRHRPDLLPAHRPLASRRAPRAVTSLLSASGQVAALGFVGRGGAQLGDVRVELGVGAGDEVQDQLELLIRVAREQRSIADATGPYAATVASSAWRSNLGRTITRRRSFGSRSRGVAGPLQPIDHAGDGAGGEAGQLGQAAVIGPCSESRSKHSMSLDAIPMRSAAAWLSMTAWALLVLEGNVEGGEHDGARRDEPGEPLDIAIKTPYTLNISLTK